MRELSQKQFKELNEIIELKIQEALDAITYKLEDLIEGEQYDENGNVTDEFLELRNSFCRLLNAHEIKRKSINS